jgi:hypothetical protein
MITKSVSLILKPFPESGRQFPESANRHLSFGSRPGTIATGISKVRETSSFPAKRFIDRYSFKRIATLKKNIC